MGISLVSVQNAGMKQLWSDDNDEKLTISDGVAFSDIHWSWLLCLYVTLVSQCQFVGVHVIWGIF